MVVKCLIVAVALVATVIVYSCMRAGAIADRRMEKPAEDESHGTP